MALLKISALSKIQDGALILDNINIDVSALQKIAIAGETGSGKSTLLKIIAGFIQPDGGEVQFDGKHVDGPLEKLVPGHAKIAYLSQQYELRNHYRVEELLEYANELPAGDADQLIEICHVGHLLKRWSNQLSGGERQRVALTRLLLGAPSLLLLDEPFSNLDPVHKQTLKQVVRDLGEALSITCIMVSHDPQDSLSWADELYLMKDGRVVQQGAPERVYRQPENTYTASLLGEYFLFSGKTGSLPGTVPIPAGKSLFLRPGDIQFAAADTGMAVTITERLFSGSYSEYVVTDGIQRFRIPSFDRTLKIGQQVSITVIAEENWYL